MNDNTEFLSKVPLFNSLPNSDLQKLASVLKEKTFKKNQTVFLEDDTVGNAMFILLSGSAKVTLTGSDGKEAILAMLEPGEYFGEMSIIDGEPRSASVVCLESSKLLVLSRRDLLGQVETNPKIALAMLVEFSKRLRSADKKISSLALLDVYGRVANIIIDLAHKKGNKVGDTIVVSNRPTHQDIADMSGTTRETVTRILGRLQRAGTMVVERNTITILDPQKLFFEES